MLIQSFAENSVKHAFYEIDYPGFLVIQVTKGGDEICILIEDNGIGIETSKRQNKTSGTQKGIELMMNQINQINKLQKTDYAVQLMDKIMTNSTITGTKVEVKFSHK